jgi:hypothetical protein
MTLEQLHAELDEITNEQTEGIMLIAISDDAILVRAFGDKEIIRAAMEDIIDDYDSDRPSSEVYAH